MRVPSRSELLAATLLAAIATLPAAAEIFTGAGNAILVFADDADGNAAPVREISGLLTELPSVFTLMADRVHRELYVSGCSDTILVFSMDDVGDVLPLRKLTGATTGLVTACATALDLVHDELFVIDRAGAVRVFTRLADGDVAPARTITGATTGLALPALGYLDLVHDELYVANASGTARVRVFTRTAVDNATPIRTLALTGTGTGNPRGLLVDLEHDELVVVDLGRQAVRFYARTASGTATFLREIRGAATALDGPHQAVLTDNDELVIGNEGTGTSSLVAHSRSAVNNATPTRLIIGPATTLSFSTGIASDRAKNCAEGNSVDGCIYRDNFESGDICYWSAAVGSPACP